MQSTKVKQQKPTAKDHALYIGNANHDIYRSKCDETIPDLVTKPVLLMSIFLNKAMEKKDGSLHTSLVMVANAAHSQHQKDVREQHY